MEETAGQCSKAMPLTDVGAVAFAPLVVAAAGVAHSAAERPGGQEQGPPSAAPLGLLGPRAAATVPPRTAAAAGVLPLPLLLLLMLLLLLLLAPAACSSAATAAVADAEKPSEGASSGAPVSHARSCQAASALGDPLGEDYTLRGAS